MVAETGRGSGLKVNFGAMAYESGFRLFVAGIGRSNRLRQLRRVKME